MLGGGGMGGDVGSGPQDAAGLGALLGNPSGPPLPNDLAGGPPAEAPDPLSSLQDAIHAVAAAISALPDPQDTQDATAAMLTLAKVQTRLMGNSGPQAR